MHLIQVRNSTHNVDDDGEDDTDEQTEECETALSRVPASQLLEDNRVRLELEVQDTVDDSSVEGKSDDDWFVDQEFPRSDERDLEDILDVDRALGVGSETVDLASSTLEAECSVSQDLGSVRLRGKEEQDDGLQGQHGCFSERS